jgi:predicted nucleic acid-binding protein
MPEKAIVDTSVLIALEKLHLSQALCKLYSEVIIPHAVVEEFGRPDLPCLTIRHG